MTQTTLAGPSLDAQPVDDDRKCQHVDDETGDRCSRYAVVSVSLHSGRRLLACDVHAKQSWVDAANDGDA